MNHHVDSLMTSPEEHVVNVKYAQKCKHYKIIFSIYVLLQLSCDRVFFVIKNIKLMDKTACVPPVTSLPVTDIDNFAQCNAMPHFVTICALFSYIYKA